MSDYLPRPVGERSGWDGIRRMIVSAERTGSGNLSLRVGETLSEPQGERALDTARAENAAENRYQQVSMVTLSRDDARVLYNALVEYLEG